MTAKSKILVVDDDRNTRQLYVSLLSPFGHQVLEASDGQEGLEIAKLEKPDLIVSDILMPTMNGYEFVNAIRKFPPLKDVPVIFHSASFLDREARALGASCGVSLYILKPADPQKILDTVHNALGLSYHLPPSPTQPAEERQTIPLLLDAFFEKGKQLDASSARLSALLELSMSLAAPWTAKDVLDHSAAAARKILGANYAAVALLDDDRMHPRSFAHSGFAAETAAKIDAASFAGNIFKGIKQEQKTYRVFSPYGEPSELGLPACHPRIRSFLGAPLAVEDRVYGWIYVAEKLGSMAFDESDAQVLTAIAAQTALACENAQRYRTIQEHAAKLESEITERKRAEERFRVLVETAPTGIIIADAKGRIVEANAHTTRMLGYTADELVGRPVEILLPKALQAAHEKHREGYAANPHARPMGLGMDLFARRKDGTQFPVEISLGPLVTEGEILVSAAIVDISARKKMEEQLRLSQRMEAIGQLAGGVAHDFNNLLTVILGSCDSIGDELPPGHPVSRKIETVKKAGTSAADLTRQLLAFGRKQILQPQLIEPAVIVDGVASMLGRLIGADIQLEVLVDPDVGSIKADPGQIEQILMNLAANARDAMPNGGRLTIELHNAELDEEYQKLHQPAAPGSYVMISVTDTGCGMDRKTQAQIFDPFFTTKELGKGTGLGLATVYGIVKQSGGYIWVYSELGKGSAFKVYLPRVDRGVACGVHSEPEKAPPRGTETILVAEDSESLREMTSEYLESIGYTVIEAGCGSEALRHSEEFQGPIHLLLTDVVMPEMNGRELADQIVRKRPGIKVLFTSGYTDDAIVRHGVLEPGIAFIQKPYGPKAIARKIRELLDLNVRQPHDETVPVGSHEHR